MRFVQHAFTHAGHIFDLEILHQVAPSLGAKVGGDPGVFGAPNYGDPATVGKVLVTMDPVDALFDVLAVAQDVLGVGA